MKQFHHCVHKTYHTQNKWAQRHIVELLEWEITLSRVETYLSITENYFNIPLFYMQHACNVFEEFFQIL